MVNRLKELGLIDEGGDRTMAARKSANVLTDRWKDTIRVSMLIKRLIDHGNGKVEMTQSQVRAIEIVLSKLVPTLASTTSDVKITHFTAFLDRIAALDTHAEPASNPNDAALH